MGAEVKIPEGAAPYKRTALFTNETVPLALMNDHSTKAGVWGCCMWKRAHLISLCLPGTASMK